MPDSQAPDPQRVRTAESLYGEFRALQRRDGSAAPSFEEFCGSHPEMRTALELIRSLDGRDGSFDSVAGGDGSLGQKLNQRFGGLDATNTAADEAAAVRRAGAESSAAEAGAALLAFYQGARQRYETRSEIGRGGMGAILKVWDRDLHRDLAMKVLRSELESRPTRPDLILRFLSEAQVQAQLNHPGIVPVHEIGVDAQGRAFFTMQLVKGRHLGEVIAEARGVSKANEWNLPRMVGVLVKVCQAVAFAHKHDVVHRDLKPANVMVGELGEVYVMDWGLARVENAQIAADAPPAPALSDSSIVKAMETPSLTLEGTVLGTPAFMPPEQAAGRLQEVDRLADVYALGAMLYNVLAGAPPYSLEEAGPPGSPRELVARVIAGPPRPLAQAAPGVPAELASICEKAMARDRASRYASARELAEDLQAHLDGRVVRAHERGAWAELKKWVQRNRAVALTAAGAMALSIAGLVAFLFYQEHARVTLQLEKDAVQSHADLQKLADARREAEEELWPCAPAKVEPMREWIARAEELLSRRSMHAAALAALPQEAVAGSELERRRSVLLRLESELASLLDPDPTRGALASVRERLEFASTIFRRSVEELRAEWERAIASIAHREECPLYGGLRIAPQVGLVPLGRNASGLWEFAHLQTGEIAKHQGGAEGKLRIEESTGLVFVLVPGGSFTMGASKRESTDPPGPNLDPDAEPLEGPAHEVQLDPFFLSKFEMTQGQWSRFTRENPSRAVDLRHPVEYVTRHRCVEVLRRLGLELPTEAQWEYAARAGTTTRWSTDSDGGGAVKDLQGFVNIADRTAKNDPKDWDCEVALEDGYVYHAPVGSFRPNAWGMHDMLGNVWEWVRDDFTSYRVPPEPGTGLRHDAKALRGAIRGGSFIVRAFSVRSANRFPYPPANRDDDLGLRPVFPLQKPAAQ